MNYRIKNMPRLTPALSERVTVAQLIEALRACPQDAIVSLDGCDCFGDASGSIMQAGDGNVVLVRSENDDLPGDDSE